MNGIVDLLRKKGLTKAAKKSGSPIKLAAYTRYVLGEGIEKEVTDFAAEVASVVNG